MVVMGGSQHLLSPKISTVEIVLWLELWLLLGCDNLWPDFAKTETMM